MSAQVERSYLNTRMGLFTLRRRVTYDETMRWGLYKAMCEVCFANLLLWVELSTGRSHKFYCKRCEERRAAL